MSWLKVSKDGKRAFKAATMIACLAGASLALNGCGFQPLYGTTANGTSLPEIMKTVEISTIPGRVGLKLRNELYYGTTGGGANAPTEYRLDIIIRESIRNTLVVKTGDATGQIYEMNTEFRLVRIKDGEVVFKGASTSSAAYDVAGVTGNLGSAYGDTRARINAENRAAKSMADTLKTRIAAFLSRST